MNTNRARGHRATSVASVLATGLATAIATTACQSVPNMSGAGASSGGFLAGAPGVVACKDAGGPCFAGDAGVVGPFQPQLGAATTAAIAPPPISGGTLLALSDGGTAVASDPDRDAIYVVDLASGTVTFTVTLESGDEPGRLAEDGAGRVHVALRGGGALVTLDPATGTVVARRNVCPAPRGVAWDSSLDAIWVACATGELVALPSSPAAGDGGAALQSFVLQRDLRDVLVQADGLLAISVFRAAEILRVDPGSGTVRRTDTMPPLAPAVPQVAWRTVATPQGGTLTVHQEHTTGSLETDVPGGYGGALPAGSSATASFASVLDTYGDVASTRSLQAVLPVDVALSPDGDTFVVAAAGNAYAPSLPDVIILSLSGNDAVGGVFKLPSTGGEQAIAVAFDPAKEILVQTREPATLQILDATHANWRTVVLSTESRADTGHALFHSAAGGLIACASCHPEGGDDGHVWTLDGDQRRTPSLRGTVAGTAPYHWPGDELDMPTLLQDVYTSRMSGPPLDADSMSRIATWVEAIPAPLAPSWVDPAAAARGQALFTSATTGCATCHSGPKFTNNATVDVGTGAAFQVPPLVGVGWRTPLMHDGCAAAIADRFGACATAGHGSTQSLSSDQISDLTAYLETL